jgi:hypothetical protein
MWFYLRFRVSDRNSVDADFSVVLAMSLMLLVVFAPAHLENPDLVVTTVREHGRRDAGPGNHGRADPDRLAFTDQQNLVKRDLRPHVSRYLFYLDFFASDDTILLAAGFYHRVHGVAPVDGLCRESRILFAGRQEVKAKRRHRVVARRGFAEKY